MIKGMKLVKTAAALAAAIALVACAPLSSPPPAHPTSTTGVLLRARMQQLLVDQPSFNDLAYQFGLQPEDTGGLNNVMYASSDTVVGLEFDFGNTFDLSLTDPKTFPLLGVSAPASLLLPEYVGMRFADIPIFLEVRGPNVQMQDDYGAYQITVADPEVLGADDSVYMQFAA